MVFFLIHTFKNKILKVCINNCTFVLYFLHSEMPKIFFHNTIKKLLSALMNVAKNKTNLFLTRFRGCDKTKIGCYFYCAFFVNFRRLWRWAKWKNIKRYVNFVCSHALSKHYWTGLHNFFFTEVMIKSTSDKKTTKKIHF